LHINHEGSRNGYTTPRDLTLDTGPGGRVALLRTDAPETLQITVQQEGATGTGETAAFVARLEGGLIAVSLPEGSGSIRVANPQGAVVLPLPGPVTFSDERPRVASTPARSGRVVEKGLRAGRGMARRLGVRRPGFLRRR